jgi:hypothetical protein
MVIWTHSSRYSENVARQKFFRTAEVGIGSIGIAVTSADKDFGRGN